MTPTEYNPSSAGAWSQESEDDLRKTSLTQLGIGADADLPDEVRFVAGIAKLIRARRTNKSADQDGQLPALFLLAPTYEPVKAAMRLKRVPRLQAGLEPLTNRIWFMQATALSGKSMEHHFTDIDDLFQYVVAEMDLGDVPAVLYNPLEVPATLVFYERGVSSVEVAQDSQLEQVEITLEKIFEAIDGIHMNNLVTPEANSKAGQLWKNRAKFWPVQQAEDVVQLYLKAGLAATFPTCTIRVEQTQNTGRLDLEIEESNFRNPSTVVRHALLELKVLRSFRSSGGTVSSGETHDWVRKGMEQAAAYREERGTTKAALCCFDMRSADTGEECFNHIATDADKLAVTLKRWYLYSTSAAYRTARASSRLGS